MRQGCQFLWKIDNWSQRAVEASSGRKTLIKSPPFYSGRYGYKMGLTLMPNGDGAGKTFWIFLRVFHYFLQFSSYGSLAVDCTLFSPAFRCDCTNIAVIEIMYCCCIQLYFELRIRWRLHDAILWRQTRFRLGRFRDSSDLIQKVSPISDMQNANFIDSVTRKGLTPP